MRALLQRVRSASVKVDGALIGSIGNGLLILFGVTHNDTPEDALYLAEKAANLRIFCDENGKMNRSLLDLDGEALVVSQFTLYGDARKGRRPGFSDAADPKIANALYLQFVQFLRDQGVRKVDTGKFAADMLVTLENDGPVTLLLESREKQSTGKGDAHAYTA